MKYDYFLFLLRRTLPQNIATQTNTIKAATRKPTTASTIASIIDSSIPEVGFDVVPGTMN